MNIDILIDAWKHTNMVMRARAVKRLYGARYRKENREKLTSYYVENKERVRNRQHARYKSVEGRGKTLYAVTKRRALAKGLEFSIPLHRVLNALDEGVCERTGISFEFGPPLEGCRIHPWAPSIDRVDNSRGYTADNVQIVCSIFNLAKNDFPEHVVYALAHALVNNKGQES